MLQTSEVGNVLVASEVGNLVLVASEVGNLRLASEREREREREREGFWRLCNRSTTLLVSHTILAFQY